MDASNAESARKVGTFAAYVADSPVFTPVADFSVSGKCPCGPGKKKNKSKDKDTHRSVETPKNPAFAFVPGISTEQRRKVEERSASATVCNRMH